MSSPGICRAVTQADLKNFGIPFSRVHIARLVERGEFPPPFKLGANRNAWWESEIVDFLKRREASTRGLPDPERSAKMREAALRSPHVRRARNA